MEACAGFILWTFIIAIIIAARANTKPPRNGGETD